MGRKKGSLAYTPFLNVYTQSITRVVSKHLASPLDGIERFIRL